MVVGLPFLGCIIAYTDRVNISVAAVAMKEHFGWSQTEKGFVLSAFFVGYFMFMFMFVAGLRASVRRRCSPQPSNYSAVGRLRRSAHARSRGCTAAFRSEL